MPVTPFPQETDEPRLDVTLPVGTHVFKLTVIDNAGMRSQPATVVIRIAARQPPEITNIAPDEGRQGSIVNTVIYGRYLDEITSVAAYFEEHQDDRVPVAVQPGGTSERLPVHIEILPHARPGLRTLEVTTPDGVATVDFNVAPETRPEVAGIAPESGPLGNTRPHEVTLMGEHLKQVEDAVFLLRGRPDDQVRATIKRVAPEAVTLDVAVSANAEFGSRRVQLTTPTAVGVGPANAGFRVVPGLLQVGIILLGLAGIVIHALAYSTLRNHAPLLWPMWRLQIPMALVYLVLLAALYLPLPGFSGARPWLRWVLIVAALADAIGWLVQVAPPGYETAITLPFIIRSLFGFALAVLVFLETLRPQWKDKVHVGLRTGATLTALSGILVLALLQTVLPPRSAPVPTPPTVPVVLPDTPTPTVPPTETPTAAPTDTPTPPPPDALTSTPTEVPTDTPTVTTTPTLTEVPTDTPEVIRTLSPVGSTKDGSTFEDKVPAGARVLRLEIKAGTVVDSIQTFLDSGTTDRHGGDGGSLIRIPPEGEFGADEYITRVDLVPLLGITDWRGEAISQLTVYTNKAQYGPYGSPDGVPVKLEEQGYEIVGFTGRAARYLNALGVILRERP